MTVEQMTRDISSAVYELHLSIAANRLQAAFTGLKLAIKLNRAHDVARIERNIQAIHVECHQYRLVYIAKLINL